MSKRLLALFLALLLTWAPLTASAQSRSSNYFGIYNASLSQDGSVGRILLDFTISSKVGTITTLGISKIQVYNFDGSLYKTINGSTVNGLLRNNVARFSDDYAITCVPGRSYYCVVTFYARDSSGTETKVLTTGCATARPLSLYDEEVS